MSLLIKQISYGSPEYEKTLALRYEILRKPLGLTFSSDSLRPDETDFHFAAFRDEQILGCLILAPQSAPHGKIVKMRQVAIAAAAQGQGVGRKLVEASEAFARDHGFELMKLNARDTAVPFYLALGYVAVGEAFSEVGLPHRLMQKNLSRT